MSVIKYMLFDLFGYQFNIFEIPLLIFLMGYFIIQYFFQQAIKTGKV